MPRKFRKLCPTSRFIRGGFSFGRLYTTGSLYTIKRKCFYRDSIYCVDLEVWSKFANCVRIVRIASKCARDFDCDWQRVNAFSHCVTLIRFLLSQIISYSDAKVPVLVVMECKRAK